MTYDIILYKPNGWPLAMHGHFPTVEAARAAADIIIPMTGGASMAIIWTRDGDVVESVRVPKEPEMATLNPAPPPPAPISGLRTIASMSNLQQSTVNLLLRLQEPKLSQVEKARLLQDAMDMAAMGRQAKPKAATNNLPTSAAALRIAALFHRRPTTPWQDKEIASFRKLCPVDMEDLEMVCEYTEAERRKGDGIYRRDLFTFLNNYLGEVDRARQYAEVQPKLTPGLKAGVKMVS